MNTYKKDQINLKLTDLSKYFHKTLLKEDQYTWLKEQNTKVMQQSIRQMLIAYDRFFKQYNDFPKFKSKKDNQSALFPVDAISKRNTFERKTITLTSKFTNIKLTLWKRILSPNS